MMMAGKPIAPPTINITQQPTDQTALNGSATFSVSATSSNGANLSYRWERGESSGGENWTRGTLPARTRWTSVAYGNGSFVALSSLESISSGGRDVAISSSGISWTLGSMPRTAEWISISYGNGIFVALAASYLNGASLSTSNIAAVSSDGLNWSEVSMPTSASWLSVTHGNGMFVATSNGTVAATSTNGSNWTQIEMPSSARWSSVTYGNGRFVAVVDGPGQYVSGSWINNCASSTDGVNWTHGTIPENPNGPTVYWKGVAYGKGKFVAVAGSSDNNHAATSADGINWTGATLPSTAQWSDITYGNGTFVATSDGAGQYAYLGYGVNFSCSSQDGVNWVSRSMGTYAAWRSIAYGNNRFVTVANSQGNADQNDKKTNISSASADTTTWNDAGENSPTFHLAGLTANDDEKFCRVVISSSGSQEITSNSAVINVPQIFIQNQPKDQTAVNGQATFSVNATVFKHNSSPTYQWQKSTASDPNWTLIHGETSADLVLTQLTHADNNGDRYRVVVGSPVTENTISEFATLTVPQPLISITSQPTDQTATNGMATFSISATVTQGVPLSHQWEKGNLVSDGSVWNQNELPSLAYWLATTYGNGRFVAVATKIDDYHAGSNAVATSVDGINWSQSTMPSVAVWGDIAYGNGIFVAISKYLAAISSDGTNWTQANMPAGSTWGVVTYGNNIFLAVSSGLYCATSTDGLNWTKRSMSTSASWSSVAYGNGKFVAVSTGPSSVAAYSVDGTNWTTTQLPTSATWGGVTYGNGRFVAVANNSNAAVSTDGINWTQSTFATSEILTFRDLTYAKGKFVALASTDYAATSTDGINWTVYDMPWGTSYNDVAYGNGRLVGIGLIARSTRSSIAVTSDDFTMWNSLAGKNSPSLNLTNLTTANDGERYRAVVSATGAVSVNSDPATLTVA